MMSPGEACEKPDVSGSERVGGSVFCWEKGHYDISASEPLKTLSHWGIHTFESGSWRTVKLWVICIRVKQNIGRRRKLIVNEHSPNHEPCRTPAACKLCDVSLLMTNSVFLQNDKT